MENVDDLLCPHCGARNELGAAFCASCGKALPQGAGTPRVIDSTKGVASTSAGRDLQMEELHKKAKKAAGALLAVGILMVIGGILIYSLLKNAPDPALREAATATLIIQLVLAAIYFGLYVWARKSPLPAAIVGLVLFLTLQFINAILDPASIPKGIIIKVIIVAVLVSAIQAGAQHRKLAQLG